MTREQRSQQLWSILVLGARNRQLLTYEMIGQACGVPAAAIGDFLRPIQQFCSEKKLPALTSIIVGKDTGVPGEGFLASSEVPKSQADVFAKDWLAETAPSAEQLAAAYVRSPGRR